MKLKLAAQPRMFADTQEEGIRITKKIGFDAVEFFYLDVESIETKSALDEKSWKKNLEKTKKVLNEENVKAVGMAPIPAIELVEFLSPETEKHATERLNKYLSASQYLGIKITELMPGKSKDLPLYASASDREAVWREIVPKLRGFASAAREKDITLVVESHERFESNLLNRLDEAAHLCKMVNRPNVRVLADTWHMSLEEDSVGDAIRRNMDLIGHVHLGDSQRYMPGTGTIDHKDVLKILKSMDYDGYCTFTCHGFKDPIAEARASLNYLRALDDLLDVIIDHEKIG